MRRAALERARALRTWREHNRIIHNGLETGCPCDEQPNRFRKGQRKGGCGKPRCYLCHGEKLLNVPTVKEKIFGEKFSYELEEISEPLD
jgi:hypothetical protein